MNTLLLDACRRRPTPMTPIWIMRQAGRYLPEYRATKNKVNSFVELCRTPELAAEVTLQPLDILGVDAAILFSDILVVVEAMGLSYRIEAGRGPIITCPTPDILESIAIPDVDDRLSYVFSTIAILKKILKDRCPLLGFSGLPFTLTTYMIEGGSSRDFHKTKRLMFAEPVRFHRIMETTTETVIRYLLTQIAYGVDAVQIFDTWAAILSREDYAKHVAPYTKRIFERIKPTGIPVIHYINGVAALIDEMIKIETDVIGIDWRYDLAQAKAKVAGRSAIQGNLDPHCLFLGEKELMIRVRELLSKWGNDPGHIFNLGHGIFPEADVGKTKLLVQLVHDISREIRSKI